MKYELVLWDFDGTLADTLKLALVVYNQLAAEKNFRPVTDPLAVRDMSMREFLQSHGIAAHRVPLAFSRFLKEVRRNSKSVRLFPGIVDVVRQLAGQGVRQGVVSSNNTSTIQECLQSSRIAEYFELVGGTSRIFGKESGIRSAMKRLGIAADSTLYVGDEIRDIEAARRAEVDIASVTWGLNSARALTNHHPTFCLTTPAELMAVVQ
ncbi:MAG: HAD-IA family hydrolase [Fuerstiella sp.]